jgi:hypothetical protein
MGETKRAVEVLSSKRLLADVVGHPADVVLELRYNGDQCAARGVAEAPVQEREYFASQIPIRHRERSAAAMGVIYGFQVLAHAGEPVNISQVDRPWVFPRPRGRAITPRHCTWRHGKIRQGCPWGRWSRWFLIDGPQRQMRRMRWRYITVRLACSAHTWCGT